MLNLTRTTVKEINFNLNRAPKVISAAEPRVLVWQEASLIGE